MYGAVIVMGTGVNVSASTAAPDVPASATAMRRSRCASRGALAVGVRVIDPAPVEAAGSEEPEEVEEVEGSEALEEEVEAAGSAEPEKEVEAAGSAEPEKEVEAAGSEALEEVEAAGRAVAAVAGGARPTATTAPRVDDRLP
jgi:hypothetical protein